MARSFSASDTPPSQAAPAGSRTGAFSTHTASVSVNISFWFNALVEFQKSLISGGGRGRPCPIQQFRTCITRDGGTALSGSVRSKFQEGEYFCPATPSRKPIKYNVPLILPKVGIAAFNSDSNPCRDSGASISIASPSPQCPRPSPPSPRPPKLKSDNRQGRAT